MRSSRWLIVLTAPLWQRTATAGRLPGLWEPDDPVLGGGGGGGSPPSPPPPEPFDNGTYHGRAPLTGATYPPRDGANHPAPGDDEAPGTSSGK
ncbi:hypothetical protein GCM10023225_02740 [Kineococcus glutinatus]|uniref:Uncharacterized protein n=1 Tax=Kineococcus glutinatus TaxID=1070872 RepID=A0ABP9H702_9ACTN